MSIVWSIVWGLVALVTMFCTIKYYLPILINRVPTMASEACADQEGNDLDLMRFGLETQKYRSNVLNSRATTIGMLLICAGFAALCGYFASEYSTSVIGILKMALGMGVLGCVFITDMELMLIPNLCSLILLGGRVITIVAEFIWVKDEAVLWLLNSLAAILISLLLLLLMARLTHGGIGMGDVKLFSSLGFLCGIRAVCFTLIFSFFFCALTSTGLLLTRKKRLKDSLPLGPFIWIGYGVTVLLSIM